MKKTRLYNIWVNMRQRCKNDGKPEHDNWGNRGIKVCEEWKSFENFKKWAFANGYSEKLTIDRIDNDGNYCPDNCRWATYKEQSYNRRVTVKAEIGGEVKTIDEWCKIYKISRSTVYRRMKDMGWDMRKALTYPKQKSISFNPQRTDEKYKKYRKPVIAYNETETILFGSLKEAERNGFIRSGINKALSMGRKHHGYRWRYADQY